MFDKPFPEMFSPHIARLLHFGITAGDLEKFLAAVSNWEEWSNLVERKAEDYSNTARLSIERGNLSTGNEVGLRAAAYFHFAEFKIYKDTQTKRRLEDRSRQIYSEIATLLSPPARHVNIPFGGVNLSSYLRVVSPNGPIVILINGLDSCKEVELHHFGEVFIKRGLNTLTIDGPGQGECQNKSSLLPGFEYGISNAVTVLNNLGFFDIGIFGVSFGGHLAIRSAANDRRIAACSSLGGFYDAQVLDMLPEAAKVALRRACHLSLDQNLSSIASVVNLELLPNIECPLMLIHGEKDAIVSRQQVEHIVKWAKGATRVLVFEGAEHVCTSRFAECLPTLGDWMRENLCPYPSKIEYALSEEVSNLKTKRFIDLSLPIDASPSERLSPELHRIDHRQGAHQMGEIFGIDPDNLPSGLGWAGELITLTTHSGTHMDAPWHYGPICNGLPARTIDEIPLDWCFNPGVVLNMTDLLDGIEIKPQDLADRLEKIDHTLCPKEIVLIYTGASRFWGEACYPDKGSGFGRDAILWLVEQGIRVIGTDAWGIDRPFNEMKSDYIETGNAKVVWPAHFAGRDVEYCQLEKLNNLDKLPPKGFFVSCFPIGIQNGSAGWVRAVAILGESTDHHNL